MDDKILKVYQAINFCSRYEALSRAYQFEDNNLRYTNDAVLAMMERLGYKTRYMKSENFFKLEDKAEGVKFQFHICLKYCNAELILGVQDLNTMKYVAGGPFGVIYKQVIYAETNESRENIRYPKFRTYEDLQPILVEGFSIYEDFKSEFLKAE